ncbi:Octanoyltransferase [Gimesia maris]|nr:Octanoyltransferase [Gimesia maris]|tara:strand:+ start:41232 stop:42041 length:810 start_codon:yes stop_codon:yes gene_type:complete
MTVSLTVIEQQIDYPEPVDRIMNLPDPDMNQTTPRHTSIKVYMLGCVDFDSLLTLQERALQEIRQQDTDQATLFVCEHPPIITVGREGSHAQLADSSQEFKASQLDVRWVNRGGGALLHAPGQLAVYPLLPLRQIGLGMDDFQNGLVQSLLQMSAELGIEAERHPDSADIFGRCGQFAFLGAAIKSWISYYGLYINVSPDMKLQRLIDANQHDHRLTSLSATLTREASMSSVRESIVRNLVQQFGYQRTHIFTRHPLLQRVKKKVYVHP